jgi:two-component system, chemotaxis family, protein-glutamate methylesterase/glutaminase
VEATDSGQADRAATDAVLVAASAGGLGALTAVLSELPADFPAGVAIVQHIEPHHRSMLAEILGRSCALPVTQAADGQRFQPGVVYVAPPDHHLLVDADGSLSLTRTELVHFVRPSADLLFESGAASFGNRAIGVVLTGTGSDGSLGVEAIKRRGGAVIAQDEATSDFFGMPGAAIEAGAVDFVLPLDQIAEALTSLVTERRGGAT